MSEDSPQSTTAGSKSETAKAQPHLRLYSDAQAIQEKKMKLKAQIEEREAQECTFSPRTLKTAKPADTNSGQKIHEKLYGDSRTHQEKISQLKAMNLKKENEACTCSPRISPRAMTSPRRTRPGQDSFDDSAVVTEKSASPRGGSLERSSTHARLYSDAQLLEERHKQLKAEIKKKQDEECTFSPRINRPIRQRTAAGGERSADHE